ncbi:MAG: Fic family protein [Bacteroidetes bacterium]|nr:Fic family protein [Bacteroidota bacterium]
MSFDATYPFPLPELPPRLDSGQETLVKWLLKARTELGELKGYSHALPNPGLLLSPAIIRESVASSGIENINTTVEKVLEQQLFPESEQRLENKEVIRYRDAVLFGFGRNEGSCPSVTDSFWHPKSFWLKTATDTEKRKTELRIHLPGKVLYTPPSSGDISKLIANWEKYIHNKEDETDPLIKCAISHYQFEAIHPFGDGNGRTGRILMVLYLVQEELLSFPMLYISGYINKHRSEYYRLLNEVTSNSNWTEFVEYMLKGFYLQAKETKEVLLKIISLHQEMKDGIKQKCPAIYSSDLVEQLFAILLSLRFALDVVGDSLYNCNKAFKTN